jgi:hypothetical protein
MYFVLPLSTIMYYVFFKDFQWKILNWISFTMWPWFHTIVMVGLKVKQFHDTRFTNNRWLLQKFARATTYEFRHISQTFSTIYSDCYVATTTWSLAQHVPETHNAGPLPSILISGIQNHLWLELTSIIFTFGISAHIKGRSCPKNGPFITNAISLDNFQSVSRNMLKLYRIFLVYVIVTKSAAQNGECNSDFYLETMLGKLSLSLRTLHRIYTVIFVCYNFKYT